MNFYKELEREFKNARLKSRIVKVPNELKPILKDYYELDENYLKNVKKIEI